MTISVDTEKAFDKIQHSFLIKKKKQLNIIKIIYKKSTANVL